MKELFLEQVALDAFFREYGDDPGFQQPDQRLTELSGNEVALRNCNGLLARYEVCGDTAIEVTTYRESLEVEEAEFVDSVLRRLLDNACGDDKIRAILDCSLAAQLIDLQVAHRVADQLGIDFRPEVSRNHFVASPVPTI